MLDYYRMMQGIVAMLEMITSISVEAMGVIVAGLVGAGQCTLIAWGIRVMKGSNESREAGMEAARNQHHETMTTLQTNHEATMAIVQAQGQALIEIGTGIRDQSQTLADVGAGIRAILERTSADQQRLTA